MEDGHVPPESRSGYRMRFVGWRVSNSLRSDVALDVLGQALYERSVSSRDAFVHHGDTRFIVSDANVVTCFGNRAW